MDTREKGKATKPASNSLVYPEAIVARRRKPDQSKAQDAAPHFSPTGTGRGEESGALCPELVEGVCICANAAVGV